MPDTVTVQLSDREVDVDTDVTMEQLLFMHRVTSAEMAPEKTVADALEAEEVVGEMLALIDESDACHNRELWELYADKHGIRALAERYSVLAMPVLENVESLDVATINQRYGQYRQDLFS